jgi:glycosyltransferase involved in cell wall biosynthesis
VKIAFAQMGDERWMAGEVIVRNLLIGLRELGLPGLTTALLTGDAADERTRERYAAADDFLVYRHPRRPSPIWFGNGVAKRFLHRDAAYDRFLAQQGVDVAFGMGLWLGASAHTASLAWLPDFQHVHLPDMFSAAERAGRDRDFSHVAAAATRIILLSDTVKADLAAHLPAYATKARVLSPITRVPAHAYEGDPAAVVRAYNLPERFFYLPNQFWIHKNHETVFAAVRDLKARGKPVNLVCTGFPNDHRNPRHFASLWEKVARWNVRGEIIYLGMVPHDDVLGLIRQCLSVVNPSKFEGWGISVDEARSVGKRVLISDVPSHREQSPPAATYFDPDDVDALAAHLREIWESAQPGPDKALEQAARAELPGRLRAYAESFLSVANEARAETDDRRSRHLA